MSDNLCRIPIRARFVCADNGKPVMVSAEYADIPAPVIAEYLVKNFGLESMRGGEANA